MIVPLPGQPIIVRLSGRAFIRNSGGAGSDGAAAPLVLRFNGRTAAVLAPGLSGKSSSGVPALPLPELFDYRFSVPDLRELTVETRAERALVELEVRLYGLDQGGELHEVFPLGAG